MGFRRAKFTQRNTNLQKNIFVDDRLRGHHPRALITKYNLRETWEHSKWGERFWKRQVVDQLEREGARAWREEVEQRQDLGAYKDKQLVLARADYVKNRSGERRGRK